MRHEDDEPSPRQGSARGNNLDTPESTTGRSSVRGQLPLIDGVAPASSLTRRRPPASGASELLTSIRRERGVDLRVDWRRLPSGRVLVRFTLRELVRPRFARSSRWLDAAQVEVFDRELLAVAAVLRGEA